MPAATHRLELNEHCAWKGGTEATEFDATGKATRRGFALVSWMVTTFADVTEQGDVESKLSWGKISVSRIVRNKESCAVYSAHN